MNRLLRRTLATLSLAGLLTAGTALAEDVLAPNGDTTWGAATTDTLDPATLPAADSSAGTILKDTTWG